MARKPSGSDRSFSPLATSCLLREPILRQAVANHDHVKSNLRSTALTASMNYWNSEYSLSAIRMVSPYLTQ